MGQTSRSTAFAIGLTLLSLGLWADQARAQLSPPQQRQQQREMIGLLEQRWQQACEELNNNRQTISLADAIQTGLLNNPVLAKRYADLQSSQWLARAIRREWSPSLSGNNPNPEALAIRSDRISTNTRESNQSTSRESEKISSSFYTSPRLQLNWTFLDPTRTPRLRASLSSEKAQRLLFDVSARNLILEIQSAYYRLQESRELREDYNRIYELTRIQVKRAIDLRHKGAGTQGDVDQLRAQLLQQLVQLIQIYEQELIAANQMAYTLSLQPGRLLLPSERLRPQGSWNTNLPESIREALEMREEIQASLATAEGLDWSAVARTRKYLPSVSVLAQSQLNTNNQLDRTNDGGSSWSTTMNQGLRNELGITFNWLMLDGGVSSAQSDSLKQQASASRAQAENDRLQATLEVQNSYASYTSSSMVIDTSREQLKEARKSVDYTVRVYNGTTVAATTFIQNIQNYLNASQAYKSSVRRFNTAVASLYRYSARWPDGALADLKQRRDQLNTQ